MRENDVTLSNVMEMKIDVTKNHNGVRTAINKVAFPPSEFVAEWNTIFLHCLYRRAVLESHVILAKPCTFHTYTATNVI